LATWYARPKLAHGADCVHGFESEPEVETKRWAPEGGGGGVTAEITSVALCVEPPSPAPIAAFTVEPTVEVMTVKLTELAPAGTVTLLGTVADDELLLRATTTPPAGAAPDNVTVP
jgi:hypothetical protein